MSTYGSAHFIGGKAGMEGGASKEHVARVVQELNEGSAYHANALARDAKLAARVEALKAVVAKTSPAELRRLGEEMAAHAVRAEEERSCAAVWAVVDMDAFFCAVEQRDQPHLAGVPMAVGGKLMLCTANYEARKHGVRSAMPGFIALKLCPELVIIPPHFDKYKVAAEESRTVFRRYDEGMSAGSLDEAYLNLSQHVQAMRQAQALAVGAGAGAGERAGEGALSLSRKRPRVEENQPAGAVTPAELASIVSLVDTMRAQVTEATKGLTCSAGIGPNSMLAKVASNDRKPNGTAWVPFDRSSILAYMATLEVRKLPGVGKVTERLLTEGLGCRTCGDIIAKAGAVRAAFNERMSTWLLRSAMGIAESDAAHGGWDAADGPGCLLGRKSISGETTFADCADLEALVAKAVSLAEGLAVNMGQEGIIGRTVTVKMKLASFEVLQRSVTLAQPTVTASVLAAAAVSLLRASWPLTLRLIGVKVSSLTSASRPRTALDSFLEKGRSSDGAGADDDDIVEVKSSKPEGKRGGLGPLERLFLQQAGRSKSSAAGAGAGAGEEDGDESEVEVIDLLCSDDEEVIDLCSQPR